MSELSPTRGVSSPGSMPTLLEDLPVIVWLCDTSGHWLYCNRAAQTFLGRNIAETAGEGWMESVHPEDCERAAAEAALATCERRECEQTYRIRRHDGTYRWMAVRAVPWQDERGDFFGMIATASDVTHAREAEAQRSDTEQRARSLVRELDDERAGSASGRFARILEATTDFVGMARPDGTPTYVNAAGRKMLGLGPDDAFPPKFTEFHPPWAREIVTGEGIPSALREGYWKGETALLRRDGSEIPVSQVILSHTAADGSVEFLSTIIRDISARKREEVARIEWVNRYEAAIRASGQVLIDWNSATNDIAYGGDVERVLGYASGELHGGLERFRQMVHPLDLQKFDDEVQRVTATRDPFRLEFRMRRKDQGEIVVAAKGYFILDRSGHFGSMVGFLADITEQRAGQDALARAHENLEIRVAERTAELARAYAELKDRALQQEMVAALGQHALTGVALKILLDEAAELVRTTMRVDFCSVLEISPAGDVLDCVAQSGWPDPELTTVPAGYRSQSGYTLLVRYPVIMEDSKTESRFDVSAEARDCGTRSGLTVVIDSQERPIGVLAAFSRETRVFNQDDVNFLQSVANVLTAAIDRKRSEENVRLAREQAEMANRAKSEFLSRMSHELRTPLNAILGFTQLLEIDKPTPSQAESVEHISRAGKHLLTLIDEVLDISRIDTGRLSLTPEPVELAGFLREVAELNLDIAREHKVEVVLDPSCERPALVLADRRRLQQVFVNLLSNGVKYNRPGGRVVVTCSSIEESAVRISVADTGRGISQEKLARLFLPFERLGAEDTGVEGSGIGLALSRGIVNALRGEMGVNSVEGKGSTFWVVLPCAPAPECKPVEKPTAPAPSPEKPAAPVVAPAVGPSPSSVLYIEDQDLNVRLIERIFHTRPEYRLLTAMRGGLGLEMARSHRPDIILLDVNLPDMTGDDVLRKLKSDPSVRNIPVIMVSADASGVRADELMAKGASGYLTKPYRVPELLRLIGEKIARKT